MSIYDLVEEHDHEWGAIDRAPYTGTPHRKCIEPFCRVVSIDLDDELFEEENDS